MKDNKNIVIALLCTVLCVMAVAYAVFSTTLSIEGTATIESNWKVIIQNVTCDDSTSGGTAQFEETQVSYDSQYTKATITPKFVQPGDKTVCTITVKNEGDLTGYLSGVTPTTITNKVIGEGVTAAEADAIHYAFAANTNNLVENNPEIAPGATHTFTVTAEYFDLKENGQSVTLTEAQKTRTLDVVFTYKQKVNS